MSIKTETKDLVDIHGQCKQLQLPNEVVESASTIPALIDKVDDVKIVKPMWIHRYRH